MGNNGKKNLADQKRKARAKKQAKIKPQFKIEILAFENGDVSVEGAIGDPALFMRLIAGAMNTVAKLHVELAIEAKKKAEEVKEEDKGEDKGESRIILPFNN